MREKDLQILRLLSEQPDATLILIPHDPAEEIAVMRAGNLLINSVNVSDTTLREYLFQARQARLKQVNSKTSVTHVRKQPREECGAVSTVYGSQCTCNLGHHGCHEDNAGNTWGE